MAFTKITSADLNSRGATTLPNQPAISANALKQEFDAPAKEVVAPKVNKLIDDLESNGASSIGATAPTGQTGNTVQAVINSMASEIADIETRIPEDSQQILEAIAEMHTHSNKSLLDTYTQTESDLASAVSSKHSHSNKDLLDTYTQTNSDLASAVSASHSHENKSVLDKLSVDSSGNPTFDGSSIPTSSATGDFQTAIGLDLVAPTGSSGQSGDLNFVSATGDSAKDLYRYENGSWVKVSLVPMEYGTNDIKPFRKFVVSSTDIGEGADLDEGTIYIVYENLPNKYTIKNLDTNNAKVERFIDSTSLGEVTVTSDTSLDGQIRLYMRGAYNPGDVRWYVQALTALTCNNVAYSANQNCTVNTGTNTILISS